MKGAGFAVIAAACCFVAAGPSRADDDWNCGGAKIVEIGMTQDEVLESCGPPSSKSVDEQARREGKQYAGTVPFERWTYSSYSSTRVLTFDQGKLIAIDSE